MRLGTLLAEAGMEWGAELSRGRGDVEVSAITMNSQTVAPGTMFVCVVGANHDGHVLAPEAVAHGAVALVTERPLDVDVAQVVVASSRAAVGPLADALHGHPSRSGLRVVGVTGTNGKTTTVALLRAVFEMHGWRSTAIGTLSQTRTTPEAPELQDLLARWRDHGGGAVALEVSSHALAQHRVDGVQFAAGVFTNLTQDHLDYHHSMDAYFEAKARLFEPDRIDMAVINRDDSWAAELIGRVRSRATAVETFGATDATDLRLDGSTSRFSWDGRAVTLRLGGRFNVANALAAATTARALGVPSSTVVAGLGAVSRVPGRFETVEAGQDFTVLVDYAHTPDGLEKVLSAARELAEGSLIVVFGAGGDRDPAKRPAMGRVAARLADLSVVTSDNPRTEDPEAIIAQVVGSVLPRRGMIIQPDRAEAIATALAAAGRGDVVVVAGKGHEKGQDVGGRILPFDDVAAARRVVGKILRSRDLIDGGR